MSHHHLQPLAAAASLGLLLAAAPASAANYFADTKATASATNVSPPPDHDTFNQLHAGGVSSSTAATVGTPSYLGAEARAGSHGAAEAGAARAVAESNASAVDAYASQFGANASAQAYAEFRDAFPLLATGFSNGTKATLTFAYVVHGGTDMDVNFDGPEHGNGGWSGSWFWRGTAIVNGNQYVQAQSISATSSFAPIYTGTGHFGRFEASIPVTLGQSVNVLLRAEATAASTVLTDFYGPSSVGANFTSDLGSTVSWGGIVGLRTLDGRDINSFSAVSASSGFDYGHGWAATVPEPSAVLLQLAGLIVLGAKLRR